MIRYYLAEYGSDLEQSCADETREVYATPF